MYARGLRLTTDNGQRTTDGKLMTLYPFKFRPRLVEKMWGGRKLETVLGKSLPKGKQIGESWELYDFPPGVVEGSVDWVSSEIANGPLAGRTLHWAVGQFKWDLYGDVSLAGEHGQFPLLIKFLDAREDLSVQVHPDQAYASANPGAHLKSEAWYVVQSDPGSRLLKGLRPGTTRQAVELAIQHGDVDRLIQTVPAAEDECFYLPSGTVHALGAGLLVAEVQTPSDTTFRVFDFNRIDPTTGKPRSLHVKQAVECIDFSGSAERESADPFLVNCPYFCLDRLQIDPGQRKSLTHQGPAALIGIRDTSALTAPGVERVEIKAGDVWLLPAAISAPILHAPNGCTVLHVTFPARQ